MMINTLNEDGNYVDLGGEFPLEENEHFNKLSVSTQQSVIQVPTNVYNKGETQQLNCSFSSRIRQSESKSLCLSDPDILNGVLMSEALNDIFTSNFDKDPTLTWQYFGSSAGFFRLYPGNHHTTVLLLQMHHCWLFLLTYKTKMTCISAHSDTGQRVWLT